jgi:hypothetical protein
VASERGAGRESESESGPESEKTEMTALPVRGILGKAVSRRFEAFFRRAR